MKVLSEDEMKIVNEKVEKLGHIFENTEISVCLVSLIKSIAAICCQFPNSRQAYLQIACDMILNANLVPEKNESQPS